MKTKLDIKYLFIAIALVLIGGLVAYFTTNIQPIRKSSAQTATQALISVEPATGTYTVGQTFSFRIYVNVGATYNAAQMQVYYSSGTAQWQYVGGSFSGSAFNGGRTATPKSNGYGNYIELNAARASGTGGLNGKNLVATLTFKATKAGNDSYMRPRGTYIGNYPYTQFTVKSVDGSYATVNPAPPPPTDVCPNLGGAQPTVPAGYIKDGNGNCVRPAPPPPPRTTNPTPPPSTTTPAPSGGGGSAAPNPKPEISESTYIEGTEGLDITQESAPSETGLDITDLAISEQNYHSVTLTWKTTKPANSKANYSTEIDDLYFEKKDDTQATDHKLVIDKDLKAGTQYYVRVTSDDGSGPVTADSEFNTKPIPVIVLVTDESNKPLKDATVTIGEFTQKTDEKGEAKMESPEGDINIFAEKDDLSREISATVDIPTDATAEPQRITMTLGKTSEIKAAKSEQQNSKKNGLPIWLTLLIGLFVLSGLGYFILLFIKKKRQSQMNSSYASDPLEAENYSQPTDTVPDLPAATPIVTQTDNSAPITPPVQPVQPPVAAPPVAEPTYQDLSNTEMPHHTSLKDMISYNQPTPPIASDPSYPYQPEDNLPITPVQATQTNDIEQSTEQMPASDYPEAESIPTEAEPSSYSNENSDADVDGDTLNIHHKS